MRFDTQQPKMICMTAADKTHDLAPSPHQPSMSSPPTSPAPTSPPNTPTSTRTSSASTATSPASHHSSDIPWCQCRQCQILLTTGAEPEPHLQRMRADLRWQMAPYLLDTTSKNPVADGKLAGAVFDSETGEEWVGRSRKYQPVTEWHRRWPGRRRRRVEVGEEVGGEDGGGGTREELGEMSKSRLVVGRKGGAVGRTAREA